MRVIYTLLLFLATIVLGIIAWAAFAFLQPSATLIFVEFICLPVGLSCFVFAITFLCGCDQNNKEFIPS